jgi:hypothetical protein
MAYSKAKLKSSGDRASPCFRLLGVILLYKQDHNPVDYFQHESMLFPLKSFTTLCHLLIEMIYQMINIEWISSAQAVLMQLYQFEVVILWPPNRCLIEVMRMFNPIITFSLALGLICCAVGHVIKS